MVQGINSWYARVQHAGMTPSQTSLIYYAEWHSLAIGFALNNTIVEEWWGPKLEAKNEGREGWGHRLWG